MVTKACSLRDMFRAQDMLKYRYIHVLCVVGRTALTMSLKIFGDGEGNVVHLRERECSTQRRHQKVIEECPSPFLESHPG